MAHDFPCPLAKIPPLCQHSLVGLVGGQGSKGGEEGIEDDTDMPKRVGNLYEKMLDIGVIEATIVKSSRGKRKRSDVRRAIKDVPKTAAKIKKMLEEGTYVPTVPDIRVRVDVSSLKERRIKIVPFFPDGIIQQLAADAMRDVLMKGMDNWSCASIPKRGNMHAMKYTKRIFRNDPKGTKYCAKLDIHHYYASIDIDELMRMFRRKIKDERFLSLIEAIFRSDPEGGLAIGYYINQWAANFYLQGLDRYIHTLDGVKYMVRNMDDIVVYGSNKRKLHKAIDDISEYIGLGMNLELKGNWQVFPVDSRGVDFVGYRFFHTHTTLRRRNFLRFAQTCRKVRKKQENGEQVTYRLAASLLAKAGQLKHCNGQKALEKYLRPVRMKSLKDIIRKESYRLMKEAVVV